MSPHNLRIWALIQVQITTRESLIADNQWRVANQQEPAYMGADFSHIAVEIERLAESFER